MTSMTTTVQAISSDNITGIGIGVIVVLVILGFVLAALLTQIIVRLVIALVVVVLAIVVWQQRGKVEDEINSRTCKLDQATFFGIHVDAPDSVRQACNR